jgi:hypothetical protein
MDFVRTEVYEGHSPLAPGSSRSSSYGLEKDPKFGGCTRLRSGVRYERTYL